MNFNRLRIVAAFAIVVIVFTVAVLEFGTRPRPDAQFPMRPAPMGTLAPTGTPAPTSAPYPPPYVHVGIQPHLPDTSPALSRYTIQDAIDYVNAHPAAGKGWEFSDPSHPVESAEFLTAGEVRRRYGDKSLLSELPDDFLVCQVKLHGRGGAGLPGFPPRFTTNGYLVFDAHSGDLLQFWMGPLRPRPKD